MSILLTVVLAGAPLTLSIDSPQKEVLVGEPFKLVVSWTAGRHGVSDIAPEERRFERGTLRFLVDDGTGERSERETNRTGVISETIWGNVALQPGETLRRNYVLNRFQPGGGAPLFSRAGRYRLRAVQEAWSPTQGHRAPPVVSNRIVVTVREPQGDDRHVLAWLAKNPALLAPGGRSWEIEQLEGLITGNPRSPYLRFTKLDLLLWKAEQGATESLGGSQAASALRTSDPTAWSQGIRGFYAALLKDVLAHEDWGPFAEEASEGAVQLASQAGDHTLADRLRADLLERYPRSAAANAIARAARQE